VAFIPSGMLPNLGVMVQMLGSESLELWAFLFQAFENKCNLF
jgi:hypothetical protein